MFEVSVRKSHLIGFVAMLLVCGTAHASWLSDVTGVDINVPEGTIHVDAPDLSAIERLPDVIQSLPESLPGELSGLAAAIRNARSRAIQTASPIPWQIRQQLAPYIRSDLLDRARYSTDWGAAANGTLYQVILGN